ncbi:hypothetical protein MKK58_00195, partial [Methylobacterium sp. J-078]|nr:hypothetical protein [Methylobacterium sp. J-078]
MCGIVGIVGRDAGAGQLGEALRRLEYRGYDSGGIATLAEGRLERRRAEGKQNLGQITLANFANDSGLDPLGNCLYRETAASCAPVTGLPGY